VLVDEALHSAKPEKQSKNATASLTEVATPVEHVRKKSSTSTSSLRTSDPSNSHLSGLFNSSHMLGSPCGSTRSSTSSLVGSSVSSLVVASSSEQRILDDLKRQIAASALRIIQLEREVQQIPKLTSQVKDLEMDKEKLGNNLLDHQEVVQTLKQRISVLHEQNGQLAKLVHTQKGGSGEVLSMRNALVASLTQLKRLQEQVNTIPELKKQVTTLTQENAALKDKESEMARHFPVELPDGVKPVDYKSLSDENSQLKSTNRTLTDDLKLVRQQLSSVSALCDGLKKRMETYESSQAIVGPLQERIKRLEKEKDDLYQEIIDAKLHHQVSADLDTAHLSREVAVLQKTNSQLLSRMEQIKVHSRQQKEQLVLKLFEIEALHVRTRKYEVEKQVLEIEQVQLSSEFDQHGTTSHSPDLNGELSDEFDVEMQGAPPESKIQLIKLQELRMHAEQSRSAMEMLLAEKEELERRVSEQDRRLEEKGVADLEKRCEDTERKLSLARERISIVERKLRAAVDSNPQQSSLVIENEKLRSQVAQLEVAYRQYSKLAESRKEMEENIRKHDSLRRNLEKAKESKRKAEAKYKESREKLELLANKLAGSAKLLKDYQEQSAALQEQLDQARSDQRALREDHAAVKAKLEVLETEREMENKSGASDEAAANLESLNIQHTALQQTCDEQTQQLHKDKADLAVLSEKLKLASTETAQLHSLVDKTNKKLVNVQSSLDEVSKERDDLQQTVELLRQKSMEDQSQYQRLQSEKVDLMAETDRLHVKIQQLSDSLSKAVSDKSNLESKLKNLSAETSVSAQQMDKLHTAKQEVEKDFKQKAAEVDAMVQSTAELKQQLRTSQALETQQAEKLKLLQSDLDCARKEVDRATVQREEISKQLEKSSAQVSLLKQAAVQRDADFDSLRKELDSANHQSQQLRVQLSDVTKHLQEEQKQKTEVEKELALLKTGEMKRLCSELKVAQSQNEKLATDLDHSTSQVEDLRRAVDVKTSEVTSLKQQSETATNGVVQELKATKKELSESRKKIASLEHQLQELETDASHRKVEAESLHQQLTVRETALRSQVQSLQSEKGQLQSQLQVMQQASDGRVSSLETKLKQKEGELQKSLERQHQQKKELEQLQKSSQTLSHEVEGYRGTIKSLQRKIDEAETREIEHEILKQKIQRLEATLSDSSQLKHDNQALLKMLQETVRELPSFTTEANRSLQEENLRLEQQVSVLSQWNDKQRQEIEMLEKQMDSVESEKHEVMMELMERENREQENQLLKQELKEVEMEVNTLRRQVRADLQEEMQVKLETQTQLLSVFNAHNSSLQKQVEDLQGQVRTLGGNLEREKPVSPPPMPDVMLTLQSSDDTRVRTVSELGRENELLKHRIAKLEDELVKVQAISASVRRHSSSFSVISSIPLAPVNEEIQIK